MLPGTGRSGALAIAAALIGAVACGDAPASAPNDFRPAAQFVGIRSGIMVDDQGRQLVLRGANISQDNKRPPYFPEGSPFDTAEGYQSLADLGFSVVRYLVEWAAVEPTRGQYATDYLDEVVRRVAWARDAGLRVIIDMHQDLYGEFFSNGAPAWACDDSNYATYEPASPWFENYFSDEVKACFDAFWASGELRAAYVNAWRAVAARFADEPAVIGYDIMNEPWHGSAETAAKWEIEVLSIFYDEVGMALREVAPNQLIFFEPNPLRNTGIRETQVRAPKLPGAVYAPHYYGLDYEVDGIYDGSADAIAYNFELVTVEALQMGVAGFVGEFSARTSGEDAVRYLQDLVPVLNTHRLGFAYWELSARGGGALLEPGTWQPKPSLWRWAFVPYPTAIPGEVTEWTWQPDSGELTVSFSKSGVALLVAPLVWYPNGVDATVTDGVVTVSPGRVRYETAGDGPHTITLRPAP